MICMIAGYLSLCLRLDLTSRTKFFLSWVECDIREFKINKIILGFKLINKIIVNQVSKVGNNNNYYYYSNNNDEK